MTKNNTITPREMFVNRLRGGISRRSITNCASWSQKYRMMGKPFPGLWSFDHHPWLYEMHMSRAEKNIGQKSAQMGYTETLLNWTFYNIDINRESCLYILPTADDASDFSASRFDPALELSPHLDSLFSSVRNIGMKRAGSASLYVRGTRAKSKLKSVPAGCLAFDEVDEMVQEHIPLAYERASGQVDPQIWMVSTPTVDDFGINGEFKFSTQEHYFFHCPACSRMIQLKWPESVVITADDLLDPRLKDTHLICTECKAVLPHEEKIDYLRLDNSEHVAAQPGLDIRGFHINQLYSMTVKPWKIAESFFKSKDNPADEQELYNSKIGTPHVVKGARLTDNEINQCLGTYGNESMPFQNRCVTMGIDVGSKLHFSIEEWQFSNTNSPDISIAAKPRVLYIGEVDNFEELDPIILKYNVSYFCVDADPERRKSFELCQRFYGIGKMVHFGNDRSMKNEIVLSSTTPMVTVNKCFWMDLALGRFRQKKISIPRDASYSYKEQLKGTVKVYEKDSNGKPVGRYVKVSKHDHYALTRCYSEIALPLAVENAGVQNAESPY